MWLFFRYALAGLRATARKRRELALENIALRHRIEVLTRDPGVGRHSGRETDCCGPRCLAYGRVGDTTSLIVQPDTVVRWHRTAWRRYWTWKSRGAKRGRPRIEPELAKRIGRMTRENPRWGHMRVLGELRTLGYRVSVPLSACFGSIEGRELPESERADGGEHVAGQ